MLAAAVTGLALGVLFAVVDGLDRRHEPGPAGWSESMLWGGLGAAYAALGWHADRTRTRTRTRSGPELDDRVPV